MCKEGVRVLNFARGELVDNAALLDALNSGKVAQYFCDFPSEELLGVKGVACTPQAPPKVKPTARLWRLPS